MNVLVDVEIKAFKNSIKFMIQQQTHALEVVDIISGLIQTTNKIIVRIHAHLKKINY